MKFFNHMMQFLFIDKYKQIVYEARKFIAI